MGIEELRKEIASSAEKEARAISKKKEEDCSVIISSAQEEAKRILSNAREEAKMLAESQMTEIAGAKLEGRKIIAEAREAVVSQAMQKAMKELNSFTKTKEYPKLLEKLARKGMKEAGEGCLLRGRKSDSSLLSRIGKAGEPIQSIGGVLILSKDGKIRVDSTFEALLEEHDYELKKLAYEELQKS